MAWKLEVLIGGMIAVKGLLEIDPEVTAIVSSGYSTEPTIGQFQ